MAEKYARVVEHERRETREERVTMALSYAEVLELEAFARANDCTRSAAARWLITQGLAQASAEGGEGR